MIPNAFNYCSNTRVPNSKPLSSHATEVTSTTGGTVETGVTDYNVLFSLESSTTRRVDDETTAR